MDKYLTVNHCLALGEEIEKLTSAYKSLMFGENFGAEEPIEPELLAAFTECAECCRDFVDLFDFYNNKNTPEEEAADWEANYYLATGDFPGGEIKI